MAPAGTHYWDHHKVIKAIEKSSLQATFGPEITSTKDLLPPKKPKKPKKSKTFFGDTVKAKGESPIKVVEDHAQTKRVRSILSVEGESPINRRVKEHAQTKRVRFILPIDQTKEAGEISPNLTPNDGRKHADLTNQRGNIPSEWFTDGRSIPAIWTHENAVASILQSNFLGQVPPDVWGRNVSYHAYTPLSVRVTNISTGVRLKNFANGPARKESIAIFTTYLTQITSIQTTTVVGTQKTFSALAVPRKL